MLEQVEKTIAEHDMLHHGDSVVVAVSGGADSTALLRCLVDVAAKQKLSLTVAHLNHCIRGADADADEEFVRELAASFGLPVVVERIDVPESMRRSGGSLEEAARRERYRFFNRVAAATGAKRVAIGHTRDDNVETVIQRIVRGSGLRGLGGIPPVRPLKRGSDFMIIRPLIDVTRREVVAYLEQLGLGYRTDITNRDLGHFRNRIRHSVLPCLEANCGPDVRENINRLARTARKQYNVIEGLARDLLAKAMISREPLRLKRDVLRDANNEIAVEAMRLALEDAGVGQLTSEQSCALPELFTARTGTAISLPGGMLLKAEYDRLRLETIINAAPALEPVVLPLPGEVRFGQYLLRAEAREVSADDVREYIGVKGPCEEMINAEALHLPLTVRTRRPGDRFHPLGAPGSRKLHDFFIDARVPVWQRDSIPIVCDEKGIIWVVGFRIDERVRVPRDAEATRVAVLTCTRRANGG